jgi:hypothetical protein
VLVMFVYAGIDEAGYGPVLGPLVVGRAVFVVPALRWDAPAPDLWRRLSKVVCKRISDGGGRIVVNDSKKLKTKASGVRHLETGCLTFAGLGAGRPESLDGWLDFLGERTHRSLGGLPWYEATGEHPWQTLPTATTEGELAIAGSMLGSCAERIGIRLGDMGAAVVFEDRFNQMVAATRSKASVSFTFVAKHLLHIWENYGQHRPTVVVDRQGGRTRYRDVLCQSFPGVQVDVVEESPSCSAYELSGKSGDGCAMKVSFQVDAEEANLPVALASMVSKYTRELFMARLNHYFTTRVPGLAPTAGYAKDGKRFLLELAPHLPGLGIDEEHLRRQA